MYICRTPRPDQASEDPITLEEWKAVVRDVPRMHLYEGPDSLPAHISPPDAADGLARWAGHPMGETIWFHFQDGKIRVDGFDSYVALRMRYLANYMNARVIGPDGQAY